MLDHQEQIQDYLERSGDEEISPNIKFIEGKGFASFTIEGNTLVIEQAYGDGAFWAEQAKKFAIDNDLDGVRFCTTRNPKAFERAHGAKLIGYVMEIPLWAYRQ